MVQLFLLGLFNVIIMILSYEVLWRNNVNIITNFSAKFISKLNAQKVRFEQFPTIPRSWHYNHVITRNLTKTIRKSWHYNFQRVIIRTVKFKSV